MRGRIWKEKKRKKKKKKKKREKKKEKEKKKNEKEKWEKQKKKKKKKGWTDEDWLCGGFLLPFSLQTKLNDPRRDFFCQNSITFPLSLLNHSANSVTQLIHKQIEWRERKKDEKEEEKKKGMEI